MTWEFNCLQVELGLKYGRVDSAQVLIQELNGSPLGAQMTGRVSFVPASVTSLLSEFSSPLSRLFFGHEDESQPPGFMGMIKDHLHND